MTPGGELLRVFLSGGGFPERGAGRPGAVAVAQLTSPLSLSSCHHFHNGPSFHPGPRKRLLTTPEELPSFHERGQAPSSFHRIRRSFRLRLIDWRYRHRVRPCHGRSRTFTGQCCQPFCPGDPTRHPIGPRVVTKYRHAKERIKLLRLHQVTELGLPIGPKRDTSQTIFTWPLRRRSLPPDAGCVPSFRGSSEDFRTGLDLPE